jgi:hypothetical protein
MTPSVLHYETAAAVVAVAATQAFPSKHFTSFGSLYSGQFTPPPCLCVFILPRFVLPLLPMLHQKNMVKMTLSNPIKVFGEIRVTLEKYHQYCGPRQVLKWTLGVVHK